ncbi:MAG TPA: hypothetical protein VHX43_07695 [Xanthobacteraceae bacterium]|nr:hypothetical protein [Xanthobacteraceae bacterium]
MASGRHLQRTVAATAILMALSLQAAAADDIAYFKDVLDPGGHARTMTAKVADARACGASGRRITVLMPAFENCMSGRGWALDHYGSDPASTRPRGTVINFTDVKGDAKQQPRGNVVLQSDTRACKAGGQDPDSARFKQCMLGRGWQFIFTQYAPAPTPAAGTRAWSNANADTPSPGANNDDFIRGNDDSNRSNQAISDAVNAASQATIDSDAAAAAQQQLDSTLANMPIPGN